MKALSIRVLFVCLLSMCWCGIILASESEEEKAFLALERIEEEAETSLDRHLYELSNKDLYKLFKFHQNCRLGQLQETLIGFASEYPQPINLHNRKSTFALYWSYVFYELGGNKDAHKAEALQVSDLMFRKGLGFKHAFKIVRKLRATRDMQENQKFGEQDRIFGKIMFPLAFSGVRKSDFQRLLQFNFETFLANKAPNGAVEPLIRKHVTLRSIKACRGLLARYVLYHLGAYPRTEAMVDFKSDVDDVLEIVKTYQLELADAIACVKRLDAFMEWKNNGAGSRLYWGKYLKVLAQCAKDQVKEVKFEDFEALSEIIAHERHVGWRHYVVTRGSVVLDVRGHCEELGFDSSEAHNIVRSFMQGEGLGVNIQKNLWRIVARRLPSLEPTLIEELLPVMVPTSEIKSYSLLTRNEVVNLWKKLPWERLLARVSNGGCSSVLCSDIMTRFVSEDRYSLEKFGRLHSSGCATFHFLLEECKKKKAFDKSPMHEIKFYERVLHLSLDEFKQVYEVHALSSGDLSKSLRQLFRKYTGEFSASGGEEFKTLVIKEKLSLAGAVERMRSPGLLMSTLPFLSEEEREGVVQLCPFGPNADNPIRVGLSRFVASKLNLDGYLADVVSWIVRDKKSSIGQAVQKVRDNQVILEKWREGKEIEAVSTARFITTVKKIPDFLASRPAKQLQEIFNIVQQHKSESVEDAIETYFSSIDYPLGLAQILTKKVVEDNLGLQEAIEISQQEYLRLGLPHLSNEDLRALSPPAKNYRFDRADVSTHASSLLRAHFAGCALQKPLQDICIMLVREHQMGLAQARDRSASIASYWSMYKNELSYLTGFCAHYYLTDAELLQACMEAEKLPVETSRMDERLEFGLRVVMSSWDTFAQEKWMEDPTLRTKFYEQAAARLFNNVRRFASYYPKSRAQRAQRGGDFSDYERALTQFWCEHKFATSWAELRLHAHADPDSVWRQNFTNEHKREFAKIWFYLMPEGALDFSDRSKEAQREIFTEVLVIYYSQVEPMLAHPILNFHDSNYVKGLVTKMLEEGSESIPLLNSLAHTSVDQQVKDLNQKYPYLSEEEVIRLVRCRVMRQEDPLKKMLQFRCAGIVLKKRQEDTDLYIRELLDWIADHTARTFKEAVASFDQFLVEEQQEYQDRGWGFLPEDYEQLVWDIHVRQWPLSEALYRPVNRVVVHDYQRLLIDNPLGLKGHVKPMRAFIEDLCKFMLDQNLKGPLADIIQGPYRKKIIEEQVDEALAFPRIIKANIVKDIADKKMDPLQAVARQVRIVTGLVFPKVEFNPDNWLRRLFGRHTKDNTDADLEQVEEGHYSLGIAQLMLHQGQSYARGLVLGYLDKFVDYDCEAFSLFRHDAKVLLAFTAIRMRQIPVEDYDLPQDFVLNVHRETEFAFQLAKRAITEAAISNMQPIELICLFRETFNLVPRSVGAYREAHTARIKAGSEAARARFIAYNEVCNQLNKNHPGLSDRAWEWDGRNPKFIRVLDNLWWQDAKLCNFGEPGDRRCLLVNSLRFDPFLKPSDLDVLMPNDIDNAAYFAMRDELIDLTQVHLKRAICIKEKEEVRAKKEKKYKKMARTSLNSFFHWGEVGVLDTHLERNADLTAEQKQYRRRIALVYTRLFKPMIANQNYGELMGQLTNIIEYASTCIDACRESLVALEERPEVGLFVSSAPDLFERLAIILREARMKYIAQVALKRAKANKYESEEIEFKFFLSSALRAHFSLWGMMTSQYHGSCAKYDEDKLRDDTKAVALLYLKNIVEDVTEAISPRVMPAGDRNGNVIYLEQIRDWAVMTPWYCNKMDLDEELLDKDKPKPIVVRRLLQTAGYLDEDK